MPGPGWLPVVRAGHLINHGGQLGEGAGPGWKVKNKTPDGHNTFLTRRNNVSSCFHVGDVADKPGHVADGLLPGHSGHDFEGGAGVHI